MKRFFLSFAAKTGLFVISLGLGMVSYLLVHDARSVETNAVMPPRAGVKSLRTELSLDAEPSLLARVVHPVDAAGDALGIFYILQADGGIVRVATGVGGSRTATPYGRFADERTEPSVGFTAFALHPNFLAKGEPGYGRFYLIVGEKAGAAPVDFLPEFGGPSEHHQDVVYEYTVDDPLLAEFRGTRRELMRFRQPGPDHNVRGLAMDPSGLLYLGVGDGAAGRIANDSPSRNASSLTSAYGKVLRIDPLGSNSRNGQYGIPEGNPFRLVTEALPELWVFGLRAPESLSYDPFLRGLCIAERANESREEINLSLRGGEHFGWDIAENTGKLGRSVLAQLEEVVTRPAVAIDLLSGLVSRTTGSLVYRGEQFPSLAGTLLFASHDGQLLALRGGEQGAPGHLAKVDLGRFGDRRFSGLRQGPRGELIFLCEDGQVFEMRKGASLGTGGSKQKSMFCDAGTVAMPRG